MNEAEFLQKKEIKKLAAAGSLAVAVVDASSREISAINNNSICRTLNPDGIYNKKCMAFCGTARQGSIDQGSPVMYTCHAGLSCRASAETVNGNEVAIIVGRAFVKAEEYRAASKKAIEGEWSGFDQNVLFENVLIAASSDSIDAAARSIFELAQAGPADAIAGSEQPEPAQKADAVADNTKPEPPDKKVDPAEWRSFFTSILRNDHAYAVERLLEFVSSRFSARNIAWFERRDDRFELTAARGDLEGRAIRLGISPAHIEDVESDPIELAERSGSDKPGTGSRMLLFPVRVEGDASAVLAIYSEPLSPAAREGLIRFCSSVAPQLEILRLRKEVEATRKLQNAISRFTDDVRSVDADDFWIRLTQSAAELLSAERASLMIYDEKAEALEIKAMIGSAETAFNDLHVGERVAKIVFDRSEPVVVADVERTGLGPAPPQRGYKTPSFLSSPIRLGERTLGVMSFTDRVSGRNFDRSALQTFEAISTQLSIAVDRNLLKEKAGAFQQLSVTDALTGLLNRRYMEERLLEEIKRSSRHGYPMSFMMLDVDHFKSYNDTYGHPAGDEALKVVASVIRDTLRGADVAARFGGEEFAILLPQTTAEEAIAIAERVRHNLENASFAHRRVTASIGVSSCAADLCIAADLISSADRALYAAKRKGRNTVVASASLAETNAAA